MYRFRKHKHTAYVFRKVETVDGIYTKGGFEDTGKSYKGLCKAMSIKDTLSTNSFGKSFVFHTDRSADIQEGDKLTIQGIEYDVQGVSGFDGVSFQSKQVLLMKAGGG